jgi:hypothetical protein
MASVKFYVHKKKSKKDILQKELPIQVSFTYDSKRVITSSGDKDDIMLEHAIDMYRLIKNSQFCVLPQTSHAVFNEKADVSKK